VHLIHAVDSERLLREIEKQGKALNREISVLLQFHIAREESKYGLDTQQAKDLIAALQGNPITHAQVIGVMGMATFTDNKQQVTTEFKSLHDHFERIHNERWNREAPWCGLEVCFLGGGKRTGRNTSTKPTVKSLRATTYTRYGLLF